MHPSPGGPNCADLLADRSATAARFLSLRARGDIQQVHDYWLRGGYPEPWLKPADRFRAVWMSQYVKTYVERDIGRLFPGLDQDRFRLFLQHLAGPGPADRLGIPFRRSATTATFSKRRIAQLPVLDIRSL